MNRGRVVLTSFLVLAVMFSAVGVVYSKYQSRELFGHLQQVRADHDRAEMEWGRLQLELATSGALEKVMQTAQNRLHMSPPRPKQIVVVE